MIEFLVFCLVAGLIVCPLLAIYFFIRAAVVFIDWLDELSDRW